MTWAWRAPKINFGVCLKCGHKNEPRIGDIRCEECGAVFDLRGYRDGGPVNAGRYVGGVAVVVVGLYVITVLLRGG